MDIQNTFTNDDQVRQKNRRIDNGQINSSQQKMSPELLLLLTQLGIDNEDKEKLQNFNIFGVSILAGYPIEDRRIGLSKGTIGKINGWKSSLSICLFLNFFFFRAII